MPRTSKAATSAPGAALAAGLWNKEHEQNLDLINASTNKISSFGLAPVKDIVSLGPEMSDAMALKRELSWAEDALLDRLYQIPFLYKVPEEERTEFMFNQIRLKCRKRMEHLAAEVRVLLPSPG
ncbi:30S ribosomal protein S4, partial [Striga asiatica]